ncbi:MAG TPA: hypothetical protein RMH99_07955 [Sandaracinaceae bacterium LLY-WYZ-13_1]|nr:hypothetical protein [Sandaracinaceae bacterium LLY-WYZ-13_1]
MDETNDSSARVVALREAHDREERWIPWRRLEVSGLYAHRVRPVPPRPIPIPTPQPLPVRPTEEELGWLDEDEARDVAAALEGEAGLPIPGRPIPGRPIPIPWFSREEIRLDVDGRYPQRTISGTSYRFRRPPIHWVASLRPIRRNLWVGGVWYRDPNDSAFPYTRVIVRAQPSLYVHQRQVTVLFAGGGASSRQVTYRFRSRFFHPVELEFDHVEDADPVLEIETCAHPNRPSSLPCETLSVSDVFERAGFRATVGSDNAIPAQDAGPNTTWSDAEMHDAMQTYWSRFADRPQWALWTLFARLHDLGTGLGGVMFDDIGPNHRQGTAVFTGSFISQAPGSDPSPAAWVARMRFWTACHEMGHAFNLAHSWQKHLGSPWIPLSSEAEARSFMNYPYRVQGGESAFFADFDFRFSDQELLFVRHAPYRFVQQGNADWFDEHGFEQAGLAPSSDYRLEIGVDRDASRGRAAFEFLEPVVLQLRLRNLSDRSAVLDASTLLRQERLTVIVKRAGAPARQWRPHARYCLAPRSRTLDPGASMLESLFVSVSPEGWLLAEPGTYDVQVALELDGQQVVSNRLALRVEPPRDAQRFEQERIAQDYFTEEVGRVLAFDGTRCAPLADANATLRDVADRLADSRAAVHAQVALAMPETKPHRVLRIDDRETAEFVLEDGEPAQVDALEKVFAERRDLAETLGHVDLSYYTDRVSHALVARGEVERATRCAQQVRQTLQDRAAPEELVAEVDRSLAALTPEAAAE